MREHFKTWGWVNFLKEIAKTKVFDVPGRKRNSIDHAKAAKLFEVLIFASEEKLFNESQSLDYDAQTQK